MRRSLAGVYDLATERVAKARWNACFLVSFETLLSAGKDDMRRLIERFWRCDRLVSFVPYDGTAGPGPVKYLVASYDYPRGVFNVLA